MVGMRTALTVLKRTTSSDAMSIATVSTTTNSLAPRALSKPTRVLHMSSDEGLAHVLGALAQLDHGAGYEAAGEQQVGGAREVEVVFTLEGPGEGEDGEVEGREERGDDEAEELARAVVSLDEEHQRSEEELAAQIDDLPELSLIHI